MAYTVERGGRGERKETWEIHGMLMAPMLFTYSLQTIVIWMEKIYDLSDINAYLTDEVF